jgi:hypothetical protein
MIWQQYLFTYHCDVNKHILPITLLCVETVGLFPYHVGAIQPTSAKIRCHLAISKSLGGLDSRMWMDKERTTIRCHPALGLGLLFLICALHVNLVYLFVWAVETCLSSSQVPITWCLGVYVWEWMYLMVLTHSCSVCWFLWQLNISPVFVCMCKQTEWSNMHVVIIYLY